MGTCDDCEDIQSLTQDQHASCGRCFMALSKMASEEYDKAKEYAGRVERYREMVYGNGGRDSHRFLICKLMPYWHSLRYECRRILDWRHRHRDGRRYSWIEAWRAVVENPPTFDHFWDQEMEARCYCSQPARSCLRLVV